MIEVDEFMEAMNAPIEIIEPINVGEDLEMGEDLDIDIEFGQFSPPSLEEIRKLNRANE